MRFIAMIMVALCVAGGSLFLNSDYFRIQKILWEANRDCPYVINDVATLLRVDHDKEDNLLVFLIEIQKQAYFDHIYANQAERRDQFIRTARQILQGDDLDTPDSIELGLEMTFFPPESEEPQVNIVFTAEEMREMMH